MRAPRPPTGGEDRGNGELCTDFSHYLFFFFLLKSGMLPNANRIVQTEC